MLGSEGQAFTEQTVEEALDTTIAALMVLDSQFLAQLAQLWGGWEVTPLSLSISQEDRERLQAKLALLGRLLRQTESNLGLLGLSTQSYTPLHQHRSAEYPFATAQRGA